MGSMRKTLVVVPAYNEQAAISETLAELDQLTDDYEILVVDDGSTDDTAACVMRRRQLSRRRIDLLQLSSNLGIGAAVQAGYYYALRANRYEYVVQFDADGQHDPNYVVELTDVCRRDGLDLAIGSRFRFCSSTSYKSTWLRRIGIGVLACLISRLSGTRITDPTSGFRCAGPRAWKYFAFHYPDDYPEPESLFWCIRRGWKVAEVPVRMRARRGGISSIRYMAPSYYMSKVAFSLCLDVFREPEPKPYDR